VRGANRQHGRARQRPQAGPPADSPDPNRHDRESEARAVVARLLKRRESRARFAQRPRMSPVGPIETCRRGRFGAQRTASVSAVTFHMTGPPLAGDVIMPPVVHAQYTVVPEVVVGW